MCCDSTALVRYIGSTVLAVLSQFSSGRRSLDAVTSSKAALYSYLDSRLFPYCLAHYRIPKDFLNLRS